MSRRATVTPLGFVDPMLASPMPANWRIGEGWIAQEKYDGHRLVMAIGEGTELFGGVDIKAWSRDAKPRILPAHIREAVSKLPRSILDGELLVPGERSYGVTRLDLAHKLVFVCFDVIKLLGKDLTINGLKATQADRRSYLEEIFGGKPIGPNDGDGPVRLAWQRPLGDMHSVQALSREVWDRDGEGLILKKTSSLYDPGKRPKDWIKVKMLRSACLIIIGFNSGTMGENSVAVLRDDDGNETTVKWKNLEILHQLQSDPKSFIGRKLWIEFQERTPDGGYRHPRWDHLDEAREAGGRVLNVLKEGAK